MGQFDREDSPEITVRANLAAREKISAYRELYELDYEKLAGFVLEPGDAVNIDRGTWHTVVPLGAECLMLSGTRKGAEQQPAVRAGVIEGGQIPVAYDSAARNASPFIEYVDLRKRNRVIALEL